MKQTARHKVTAKVPAKPYAKPCIRIYTTRAFMKAVAARAAAQGRSVSKHGAYLFKQDLAGLCPDRLAS